ncbi:hypothetical protein D3C85_1079990 [compost metagenome]
MIDRGLDVGGVAAFDGVLVVVAVGAAEADGDLHLFALRRLQLATHVRDAAGALRLEVQRVDQVTEYSEKPAALQASHHSRHVVAVLPDVGLGVFAGGVAAAVQAGSGAEVIVRIGHGPDAASFAQ